MIAYSPSPILTSHSTVTSIWSPGSNPGVCTTRSSRSRSAPRIQKRVTVVVHVNTGRQWAGLCPACGRRPRSVKDRTVTAPKDLPYGQDAVKVLWHKRRWRCRTVDCAARTFTDRVPAVAPGARTSGRLRQAMAEAVGDNRCVAEVARSHRLSWPTVQRAFAEVVADLPGQPAPTPLLGIDETRFGRPRWRRAEDGRWVLVEPWETGFVDLTGSQGLLGQVDGRTSAAVTGWLAQRLHCTRSRERARTGRLPA
jgi:transposase